MRRIPILLMLMLCCSALIAQSEQPARHVVREELPFDFGFMPNQAEVTHTFWLTNHSNDSIRVASIRPGCGCLSAPLPEQPVAPQDSVALPITFHSGRFRDYIEKTTRVTTRNLDSTSAKVTLLTITGFVAPDSVLARLVPLSFEPLRMQLETGSLESSHILKPARLDHFCDYLIKEVPRGMILEELGAGSVRAFQFSRPPDSLLPASVTIHVDCDSSYNITIPIEVID